MFSNQRSSTESNSPKHQFNFILIEQGIEEMIKGNRCIKWKAESFVQRILAQKISASIYAAHHAVLQESQQLANLAKFHEHILGLYSVTTIVVVRTYCYYLPLNLFFLLY